MNPLGVDMIYCVCLDKRRESWQSIWDYCLARGWSFTPFIVGDGKSLPNDKYVNCYAYIDEKLPDLSSWGYGSNYETRRRHFNAFKSHQAIIKEAKDCGYKSILLLEDDAYFTARFDAVLQQLDDEIKNLQFDLLYLGWWIGDHIDNLHAGDNLIVEQNWNTAGVCGIKKVERLGGLHGVVIRDSVYDLLLGLPAINPIDSQLNNLHKSLRSFYLYPKVIHCKSMESSCEMMYVKRDDIP